jgi:hypothetical protein
MNGTLLHGLGHLESAFFLGSVGLAAIFDSQAAIEPNLLYPTEPVGTRQNEATFCSRWP